MKTEVNRAIRKLLIQLLAGYVLVLFVISVSIIQINQFYKESVSEALSRSVEKNLVIRDFREAMDVLDKSTERDFIGVSFYNHKDVEVFTVPPAVEEEKVRKGDLFISVIEREIGLGDGGSQVGKLYFAFKTYSSVVLVFSLWFLGLLLFVPFFARAKRQVVERYEDEVSNSKNEALATLAQQVAHDIRSPLSALEMSIYGLKEVPEDRKALIREAAERIQSIANDLIERNRRPFRSQDGRDAIFKVLKSITKEKAVQYSDKKIAIQNEFDRRARKVHLNVDGSQLKRIVSNLVNNSVEAIDKKGQIVVGVEKTEDGVRVFVRDDGKGIPKELIEKIGAKGVTSGKSGTQSGSGLGLYHAKKTVESWGGDLKISSEEGKGSEISIEWPI